MPRRDTLLSRQYITSSAKKRQPPLLYSLFKRYEIHRHKRVGDLLPKRKISLIDIGCGDGAFLFTYQNSFRSFVGIDIYEGLLRKARARKFGVSGRFVCADLGKKRTSFHEKKVDVVTAIATLQNVVEIDALFDRVHSLLSDDGLFIFEVPNFAFLPNRLKVLCGRFPILTEYVEGYNAGVVNQFTEHSLRKYLPSVGFFPTYIGCSGIFAKMRSLYPSLLGADLVVVCKKRAL